MLASLLYSLLGALLDVLATSRGDQAQLQAEVLAPRRQVQVLELRCAESPSQHEKRG